MNTPQIAIAIYQPRPESLPEFLQMLESHGPLLRAEGLLTDRPVTLLESDGLYLEMVEWKSAESSRHAHDRPAVQALWAKFEAVARFGALKDLPHAILQQAFPTFQAVAFPRETPGEAGLKDMMIAAQHLPTLTNFYATCFGLRTDQKGECFTTLVDPVSAQRLCLTDGPSVSRASPGIGTESLEETLAAVARCGGKVLSRWEFPRMKGANCADPEGNEILVWQDLP